MKVVHINTSNKGGAGIAAIRLHERLLSNGIDSKYISLHSFPSSAPEQYQFLKRDTSKLPLLTDFSEFVFRVMKKLGLRKPFPQAMEAKHLHGRPEGHELFSFPYSDFRIDQHPLVQQADIVHLHWVSDGFLDYQSFFSTTKKKIVWTLHDMFPFTGGCHHSDGCMRFSAACEVCPQLKGTIDESYSAKIMAVKSSGLAFVSDRNMKIVCPSSWLTELSQQSKLFQRFAHSTIANIMSEDQFSTKDRAAVRRKLSLPENKKIILFVAHSVANVRKGSQLLLEALNHLKADEEILLCSVGSDSDAMNYPLPHLPMGYVNSDEKMADLYAAADVFVLPSMAENFPNTICESLLCGTPVVAFVVGGIPELVNDSNGKLATPFDTKQLAEALRFVLDKPQQFQREVISENAYRRLNPELSTNNYIAVYNDLMKSND